MPVVPPIAEPRGDPQAYHSFRMRFWPYFYFMLGSNIPSWAFCWLVLSGMGPLRYWSALQYGFWFFVVPLAVFYTLSWIFVLSCRYKLGRKRIEGFTFWGVPKCMEWEEIQEARIIRLGLYSYLRVFSRRGGMSIWWPLFLVNRRQLEASILEFAPPDNPMRRYFQMTRVN